MLSVVGVKLKFELGCSVYVDCVSQREAILRVCLLVLKRLCFHSGDQKIQRGDVVEKDILSQF